MTDIGFSRLGMAASAGAGVIKAHNVFREMKSVIPNTEFDPPLYVEIVYIDWLEEFRWHMAQVGDTSGTE